MSDVPLRVVLGLRLGLHRRSRVGVQPFRLQHLQKFDPPQSVRLVDTSHLLLPAVHTLAPPTPDSLRALRIGLQRRLSDR